MLTFVFPAFGFLRPPPTLMHHGTRLTAEDTARLHMGKRENQMAIIALLMLDDVLDYETLVSRVEARLLPHRRFRQKVTEPRFGLGLPRWEDDPSFEVRGHVHCVDLPDPGRVNALEELVGELMSVQLDTRRALWDVYLVRRADAGAALVVRMHHVLADGSALLALLQELSDEGTHADTALSISRSKRTFLEGGRRVVGSVFAAGRLAMQRADPRTPLRGRLGSRKRVAFSAALPLESVLVTAHALGTTLVVVLLAAVAGALRYLLAARAGLVLHVLLPIHVRPERPQDLGNHYGSVFVPLPVGLADPKDRVREISDALRELRSRGAVMHGVHLAVAAGVATAALERLGAAFFSRRASAMVSNVRGPARALHLNGVAVRDVVVWAPSPGSIALGVTLLSYAGRVRIGVAADACIVDDPRGIVDELDRELSKLASVASSVRA